MYRNCILCSFALAALGVLTHSVRKHLEEQGDVNSNVTGTVNEGNRKQKMSGKQKNNKKNKGK